MQIHIDCTQIRQNTRAIVNTCAIYGIGVAGVTKACCGHPDVARAMLEGGVSMLADSRLANVRRMREAGITSNIMLLRLPSPSEAAAVVALTQFSLNSEVETVCSLARAAQAQGVMHRVILMVEMGDRREGIMPERIIDAVRDMLDLPGIELAGLGTNVGCIAGVAPTRENTQMLVTVAEQVERALGLRFSVISGGHSASLPLVERSRMPSRVNQLRIGEAILLGRDWASGWSLPPPHKNAFRIMARVIEVQTKPSLPEGVRMPDPFGRIPHWVDLGPRRRAILAIGEQDLHVEGLRPLREGVTLVGASSDHLVLDVTNADPPVTLGEEIEFEPAYAALSTAMAHINATQLIRAKG
ncbi:MAG TPA: alanine/ornithine racemase family PLP-dependent enzyme [Anaerolineae bacterium]|nr:alanine/ornithine racemase family PLP-dependent enzyme [Anaerolineae bacterium]HPL27919.1 alanine/ornithine racemase family PLP-dependent enzyme [Anaerolineae bacterium]